jgi:hypothetical protein
MKVNYGILDDNTFNFDETGFMMGVILSRLVVTGAYRRGKPKMDRPGNREWTTVIQSVSAVLLRDQISSRQRRLKQH